MKTYRYLLKRYSEKAIQRRLFDTPISCSKPNDYYYLTFFKVIKNINIYMA